MGRNLKSCWWVLLMMVGFAFQSAQAGDRKGGSAAREARAAAPFEVGVSAAARAAGGSVAAREARVAAQEDFALTPVSHRGSSRWISAQEEAPTSRKGAPTHPRDRKKLTLLRFDSKLGNISVQPVIGSVNGAQFSLGF